MPNSPNYFVNGLVQFHQLPAFQRRPLGQITQLALGIALAAGVALAGDAARGAQVAKDTNCLQCHKVLGEGNPKRADTPDLSDAFVNRYTAPTLTSTMWNHTPIMWQAMNDQIVARPKMTAGEAEDLFAYLYSLRYFDRAGDEERGKGRFDRIGCSGCHLVAGDGVGPAISRWTKPTDPVALARQMWNHAATMQRELAGRAVPWISISGRDIADINAYVRQVRGLKPAQVLAFSDSGAAEGRALFEGNCRRCHSGTLDISRRMANGTFLDIAAAMWNHRPRMAGIPIISSSEMQSIVAYVWQQQYLGESGSVAGGRDTFNKKCGSCHNDPVNGASRMARGERIFTPFSLLSQAWEHGTLMQQAMKNKAAGWPSLSPREVSDVVAFLNTRP